MSSNETFAPPRSVLVRRVLTICAALCLAGAGSAASAVTRVVSAGGPFTTIQAAIDASSSGDTVDVSPGSYSASGDFNLSLGNKNLTIESTGGAAVTILDNSGGTHANQKQTITFDGGQNASTVLRGFTIKNSIHDLGGAVTIVDCAVTIEKCVFINNSAGADGGAIAVITDNAPTGATISQCSFLGNSAGNLTDASGFGGAIECIVNTDTGLQQNVSVTNCVFDSNTSSYDGGAVDVAGFDSVSPKVSVVNCSFVHNNAMGFVAPDFEGVIAPPSAGHQPGTVDIFGGVATLTDCILYGDTSATEISTLNAGFTATFSDVQQAGVSGTGDFNQDPKYADVSHSDPTLDNAHLQVSSPAINAGLAPGQMNSLGGVVPAIDRDNLNRDSRADLGAYEVQPPVASNQTVSTVLNTAVGITLTGSDANTPPRTLTFSVASTPSHGTLTGAAPNLTYTPNAGYFGADSFTFTVNNGNYASAPGTVSINVAQGSATNVSGQIAITRGGYVFIRANGHTRQSVTLTNTGAAIAGPVSLVLDNLTGATLTNATGVTSAASPAGSPYINTAGLAAGASATIVLDFSHQPGGYTTRVLAGGGAR